MASLIRWQRIQEIEAPPHSRPIPFNEKGASGIEKEWKKQTRRPVKPQPKWPKDFGGARWANPFNDNQPALHVISRKTGQLIGAIGNAEPPFGFPGQILWVQEPAYYGAGKVAYAAENTLKRNEIFPGFTSKKSPKYMPYGASRFSIVVTNLRIERIQNISPADAVKEGIQQWVENCFYLEDLSYEAARAYEVSEFKKHWDFIYGHKNKKAEFSFKANPWVWVYDFERVANA